MIQREAREIVWRFIVEELPDSENIFGIINISDIIISPDGSYLDVCVSCFNKEELLTKTLAKYAYIIQRYIWKKMWMRLNPKLRFRYDDSWEVWQEITNQINALEISE